MTSQESRHSVSVAGVIINDGRALLIQRRDNAHWEPPGGVLEPGETIEEGLRREVREETGLEVEPVALTGVYKNMKRCIVALVFRCRAINGHLTINSEVADFHWALRDDIATMMSDAYAVRVLDAYDYSATPAVRAHDGVNVIAGDHHTLTRFRE
jgi:ADP-ribose pyrophosphatase YjhB (NUDIX family)